MGLTNTFFKDDNNTELLQKLIDEVEKYTEVSS